MHTVEMVRTKALLAGIAVVTAACAGTGYAIQRSGADPTAASSSATAVLPSPPPEVLLAAQRVYDDWRIGDRSDARTVATGAVVSFLFADPWDPSYARPDACALLATDLYSCVRADAAGPSLQFFVRTTPRGRTLVTDVGDCAQGPVPGRPTYCIAPG